MFIRVILTVCILQAAAFAGLADDYRTNLSSKRDLFRRQAVYGIIHSTLPASVAVALLGKAAEDRDIFTKRLAISGLGKYASLYVEETSSSSFIQTDSTAAVAAPVGPYEKALNILRNSLSDNAAIVRADTVRALAACNAPEAKEDIVKMLDDRNMIVLKEAMQAAAAENITEAAGKIIKFLGDRSEIIRLAAVRSCAGMKLAEAYKPIRKIAKGDSSAQVRIAALDALAVLAPADEAPGIMEDYLKDGDLKFALHAAFLLAKNFTPASEKMVFKAAGNKDPSIRLEAAKIMLYYNDKKSATILKSMLNDTDENVRNFVKNNLEEER